MTIDRLLEFLRECVEDGDATSAAPVVALVRGPEVVSDDGWAERPVIDVQFDDPDCDLILGTGKRESGLNVSAVQELLISLSAPGGSVVYMRGDWQTAADGSEWRHDIPIEGTARNREANVVGLVRAHEGIDYGIPEERETRA